MYFFGQPTLLTLPLPTSPTEWLCWDAVAILCNLRVPRAPAEPMHQLQLDVFPCAAWSLSIS